MGKRDKLIQRFLALPSDFTWQELVIMLKGFGYQQVSFHPERVLFRPGGVNLRACLCGVPKYASA